MRYAIQKYGKSRILSCLVLNGHQDLNSNNERKKKKKKTKLHHPNKSKNV